jgi:hypothetical protein
MAALAVGLAALCLAFMAHVSADEARHHVEPPKPIAAERAHRAP